MVVIPPPPGGSLIRVIDAVLEGPPSTIVSFSDPTRPVGIAADGDRALRGEAGEPRGTFGHMPPCARSEPRPAAPVHTIDNPSCSEAMPPHARTKSPSSRCFRAEARPGVRGDQVDGNGLSIHGPALSRDRMGGAHAVAPSTMSSAASVR